MLWEWLAVIIAGVAGAGLVWATALLIRQSSIKRLAPACAGSCMLLAVIAGEYLWAGHVKASLPANAEVVQAIRKQSPLKPWTWFVQPVQRLSAVAPLSNDDAPIILVELYLLARWQAPVKTRQWFDCALRRRANAALTGDGPPANRQAWTELAPADAYLIAACQTMRVFAPTKP